MKLIITDERQSLNETVAGYFRQASDRLFRREILPAFLMEEESQAQALSDQIEVDITVTDPEEIRAINAEYRGIDKVTDVLSFPQYEGLEPVLDALEYLEEDQTLILGDVVLCPERALEQADLYGNTPERELCYLFVHSMLHLLGYDHMTAEDKDLMRRHEESIMEDIGLTREETI